MQSIQILAIAVGTNAEDIFSKIKRKEELGGWVQFMRTFFIPTIRADCQCQEHRNV